MSEKCLLGAPAELGHRIGLFPDAPTERGVKHLDELALAAREGYRCSVAFVIQMNGIGLVLPNTTTHPAFGQALKRAAEVGVHVLNCRCCVEAERIRITGVADETDLVPTADVNSFHDLREGDRFDLGGVSIEILDCPGHTLGSVVMLIPEERMLMTGDACNVFTFMFDWYSTMIDEYEESLKVLLPKVDGKYDRVLLSHGDGWGYKGVIEDVIHVCEDIKAGRTEDIPFTFMGRENAGLIARKPDFSTGHMNGNIVYNKDRIWTKA